jgi:hypothetical protein
MYFPFSTALEKETYQTFPLLSLCWGVTPRGHGRVLYSRTMGNSAGGGIRRKDRKKWMKQFNCTRAPSMPFMAGTYL